MSASTLDTLYTKVAQKILRETLQVKKGESVTVETWDNGLPFAKRAIAEARALGCIAVMVYEDERAYVEGVRRAPEDSVGMMGKNEYGLLSGTDSYIFIPGQALGAYSKTLKPGEREKSTRYNSSWYEAAQKAGLKGARLSFGYVGKDLARILGMRVQDVVQAQLKAALTDYGQISRSAGHVSGLLGDGGAELETKGASLTFSLQGELTVEDGLVDDQDKKTGNNMTYVPPGFVGKEVDPQSANGSVVLTDTLTEYGAIRSARLDFKDGAVVGWESSDRAVVKKMLEAVPPEKRTLKLMTVGLNPALKYGAGQDRFVGGSVTLAGFGFRGQVKKGALRAGGSAVVSAGHVQG
ncbi:MAG: aminopeptidase [Thaumarchaeota archaeon]|nr:aminopeptidase [Nitrososphaerota archaeon]